MIETAKLRFFPFSLKDKAKGWLYTLKPMSIGNWGQMTQESTKKISLPTKSNKQRGRSLVSSKEMMRHYSWLGKDSRIPITFA